MDHPERGRPLDRVVIASSRVIVATFLRLRVEGGIPRGGPLIIAANHVSFLDPVVLGMLVAASGRIPRFIVTPGLFELPVLGRLFLRTSLIRRDRHALVRAAEALAAEGTVVLYPEGHVARPGRELRAKLGVAALSRRTGAPVLPVGLWGMERRPGRLYWARRRPAAVVFGSPMPPHADGSEDRAAASAILATARALVPRAQELVAAASPILGTRSAPGGG